MPITLYCDEHFGQPFASDLMQAGAEYGLVAVHLSLDYLPNAEDPEHLLYAAQRGWTILTRDEDYRYLARLWRALRYWRPQPPERHGGILWLTGKLLNPQLVAPIVTFLRDYRGQQMTDRLFKLVDGGRRWEEEYPF